MFTLPAVLIIAMLAVVYIALGAMTYGALDAQGELTEGTCTAFAVVWPVTIVCGLVIMLCVFFSDLGRAMFE